MDPVYLLDLSLFQVDGKHQDSRAEFQRLQIDIQHLDLGKTPTSGGLAGPGST